MQKLIGAFLGGLLRLKNKLLADPRLLRLYRQLANKEHFSQLAIHEHMLADAVRLDSYYQAITKYVTPNDVVLDLGTGTGILSFFAALRRPQKLYAIDHSEIIETAKVVAAQNGLTNITFIKAHSQAVTLPEKADILVQEQMGSWLFNENMIESVLDARDRLLKAGGKILPGRFELFIEPVQLDDEYRVPFIWEQTLHSIAFTPLKSLRQKADAEYFQTTIKPHEFAHFLGQTKALLTFDLAVLRKEEIPTTLHYRRPVTRAGRLDGFCLYFKAIFDEEVSFTTSPLRAGKAHTHWSIPFYRVEAEFHRPGDLLEFTLKMADIRNQKTWRWSHQSLSSASSSASDSQAAEVRRS